MVLLPNSILVVYKPAGLTPLQALDLLRVKRSEYQTETLSYAGRLDPLAEGVMLVLVGEANFEREKYLNLPKVYEAEILLGVSTDTGDIMGLVKNCLKFNSGQLEENKLKEVLATEVGVFTQAYPQFSSPMIDGAKRVAREVEIKTIDLLGLRTITKADLWADIQTRINQVTGDFRQIEILERWQAESGDASDEFQLISIRVETGSGVYVRSLAERIGVSLGVPALAYTIKRIKVGDYGLNDAIKLD